MFRMGLLKHLYKSKYTFSIEFIILIETPFIFIVLIGLLPL